jgi:hypothetical protein
MAIRSHKIPRAYLQRFATHAKRGKGKLWVYERGKPPRIGSPKGEAAERGFFTSKLPNGSLDDAAAEAWTQRIEDLALEPLIHAGNPCFVWTQQTREQMAEYWALLFARTSAFFEFHREFWERSLSESEERISSDAELRGRLAARYSVLSGRRVTEEEVIQIFNRLIPNLQSQIEVRHAYVQQLQRRTKLLADILSRKRWQVWLAPTGAEFVTCDSPVVTMRIEPDGRYYVGYGFGLENVLVLLPLSYRACLVAGAVDTPQTNVVLAHDVQEVNKTLVCCSYRFTYSRTCDMELDELVQSNAGSIRYGVDAF